MIRTDLAVELVELYYDKHPLKKNSNPPHFRDRTIQLIKVS